MTYRGFVMYPLEDDSGRWILEYLTDEIYPDEANARARADELKSRKRLYLIKYWNPVHGASEDNPTDFEGPNNKFYEELKNVKPEDCYTSWKTAKRLAAKYNRLLGKSGFFPRYKAVEVPSDEIAEMKGGA